MHGAFSVATHVSIITLTFSVPAILMAQRWDKMAAFPVPNTSVTSLSYVTSGPDGALWYTDTFRDVVGRMTTAGTITEFPVCCFPQGIASGPDGALWFGLSGAVGRITTGGVFTSTPLPVCCSQVENITPGPDGALWFTEGCCGSGNRIGRITTTGVLTEFAEIPNSSPMGITTGRDGALWFAEQGGNRIGRITTSGFIVEYPVPSCCGVQSITAAHDGTLWFTEPNANNIGRITTHGVITEYPLPNPNSVPSGITTGPDGAVWFTEQDPAGVGRIGRITAPLSGSGGPVIVEYSLPANYFSPFGITAGPDGNLWFTEATSGIPGVGRSLGQAAACGLGLNVTLANSDLRMAFTLGTSQPSTFGNYLIEGTGLKKLWSRAIPAFDPPRSFADTITGFHPPGSVSVFSLITTAAGGLTCYDLEPVATGAAASTSTTLDEARRAIIDSGIVETLPRP